MRKGGVKVYRHIGKGRYRRITKNKNKIKNVVNNTTTDVET